MKYLSYFRDVSFNELTSLPTEGLNGLNQLKLVGNFKLKGALAARDFANLRCVCLCPLFLLLVTVGPQITEPPIFLSPCGFQIVLVGCNLGVFSTSTTSTLANLVKTEHEQCPITVKSMH